MTRTVPGQPVERRQLTILFCDIEGSTALSARLDPEDLRELIVAYRRCVGEVIGRHDGYIAQHMGDGTLAYFGYPSAHETDADRAIHAALALNGAVAALAVHPRIRIRIGIATGTVVVGDFAQQTGVGDHFALGEAPNLAARLQGIAAPGQVVVSDLTRSIAAPLFQFRHLGEFAFKGLDRPVGAWEAIAPTATASRSHALEYRGLLPLVGRDAELALLADAWQRARQGEGRAILLRGDAGIGKSRLVLSFLERLQDEQVNVLKFYCSPQHTDDAYFPLRAELERAAGIEARDPPAVRAARVSGALAGLPAMTAEHTSLLIGLAAAAPPTSTPDPTDARERRRSLLAALLARIELLAVRQPLVAVFEDVHWIDPTSGEVLQALLDRVQGRPILVLVTARPEWRPARCMAPQVVAHALGPLAEGAIASIVSAVAQDRVLPQAVRAQIVGRSDGVPLFAEELTKATLESGGVPEENDLAPPKAAVPATLQASLVARLDRAPVAKNIAGIGATIGREFSYELLAAVSDVPADALESGLAQLVTSGLLELHGAVPEARFTFKHALLQDAAYGTLLRRRRHALHGRIAETLAARFRSLAAAEPQIIARHFSESQQPERATPYWLDAARIAAGRYANVEAVAYATRGLEGLRITPDGPQRADTELELLAVLGPALIATVGNAADATLDAYERGRALMCDVRSSGHWDTILLGLGSGYWARAEHRGAIAVANEFVAEAERRRESGPRCVAHRLAAAAHLAVGEFAQGAAHGEKAFGFYDPDKHRNLMARYGTDAGIGAACQWALGAWHEGRLAKASELLNFAIGHAEHIAHPNTTAYALYYGGAFPAFIRRDFEALRALTARLKDYATAHDLPHWFDHGLALEGCSLAQSGRPADGIAGAREGLARCERSGHRSVRPVFLAGLAEACMAAGRVDDAAQAIETALSFATRTEGRWMDAELWRLRGALALASGRTANLPQADQCFGRGLEIARRQGSLSLELRLAESLAALWSDCGRMSDAQALLTSVRARLPVEHAGTGLPELPVAQPSSEAPAR